MLIIGEKLNSAIPSVREAMLNRDTAFLQELAKKQVACGANYLDINTAQSNNEVEDMEWVVRIVQEVVDVPICIDTVSSEAAMRGLAAVRGKSMLNSISMETSRISGMIPLIKEYGCAVLGLTMDDSGIPKSAEDRIRIAGQLVELLKKEDIDLQHFYIDPLVLPLSVSGDNGMIFFECLTQIKTKYGVKTVSGLSNISHAMPKRKLINRHFLATCMCYGMDAAIMDPIDRKITSTVKVMNLILNQDRFSKNYLKAFRSDELED